jgi:hypothetical protein
MHKGLTVQKNGRPQMVVFGFVIDNAEIAASKYFQLLRQMKEKSNTALY